MHSPKRAYENSLCPSWRPDFAENKHAFERVFPLTVGSPTTFAQSFGGIGIGERAL
jgi:hypothetical protein